MGDPARTTMEIMVRKTGWSLRCLIAIFSISGCGAPALVAPMDASVPQGSDAIPRPVTYVPCQGDDDCPRFDNYCQSCPDGGTSCAASHCVDGGCRDEAASCVSYACEAPPCGKDCLRCDPADGGCRAGKCDFFHRCVPETLPYCATSNSGLPGCQRTEAVAIGDCNAIIGWGWDGTRCFPLVGCLCQGIDCMSLSISLDRCGLAFSDCPRDAGSGA
jgi:hypothetical protein